MSLELINPIDRNAVRRQYQNGLPVPWFKLDNFLRADFADQCASAFPTYDQVQKLGRTFTNINEKGKFQVTDPKAFPEPLRRLNDVLASASFLELVENITGIPKLLADAELMGGGLHSTGPRGHLDVHVDFNYIKQRDLHRRLNILVYLNKGWHPRWGGEFELWDKDVKQCMQKFEPIFNRCVMFNTNEVSFHGVSAVTCPPGESRKSFAAYYYTREAPSHWKGEWHDTIFHARPDEKLKSMLMPVEKTGKAVSRLLSRGMEKLKKSVKGD